VSSQTIIRIVIPLVAALGAGFGSFWGAFKAVTLMVPERAKIVVGYQGDIIEDQAEEIGRLRTRVSELEARIQALEDEPRAHLA
jgi:cell division protein FtsB